MSVAVSPYLLPTQSVGLGNGQQADLLDALLASCQKSVMNPRLPGYGRSLQPYFTTTTQAPRAELSASKGTPPPPKNKGKQKKTKCKSGNSSASASSDEESNQKYSKSPAQPIAKTQVPLDLNKGQTIKAIHKQQKAGPLMGHVWAGPSFGVAPAASEIPIPSDFLLV